MGEAVSLEPRRVVGVAPVANNGNNSSQSGISQSTEFIPNPDVKVSMSTNAIAPRVIVANAVTPVDVVKPVKPEFVMDISKYFKTTFLDLEEEHITILTQRAMLLPRFSLGAKTVPTLRLLQGKPKSLDVLAKQATQFTEMIKDEMAVAFKYKEEHGPYPEDRPSPEWIKQNAELIAKKYVFYYASHKLKEDFGMDMDYLTMPIIDHDVVTDKQMLGAGYTNYPLTIHLAKYDDLLNEYTGVSTIGRLGKELKIDGVELYKLWKKMDKAGIVTDYKWELKDDYGNVTAKTSNKWLEVASNVNVKKLVAGLNVSSAYNDNLVNYLTSLQNGKKRDDSFIKKYEDLKISYRDKVLVDNYLVMGFRTLNVADMPCSTKSYRENYMPKVRDWMKEYSDFERFLNVGVKGLNTTTSESVVSNIHNKFTKAIEFKKEDFGGEVPLGQEFLFKLFETHDSVSEAEKYNSIYEIKYK